ncbi:hypothetical protein ZIOFF_013531 [Zingiber officinale]|uniref:Uncharacterized protein n=1 Tax=Zingiber officinale TaxID=94328 RepID=A0A8J5LU96_ZINOF|nr:hypothetical protein ZIOFF_013531 [Zingiber officinale]
MVGVGLDSCCRCAHAGARLKDQFSSSDVFFKYLKSLKKARTPEVGIVAYESDSVEFRELQAVERHLNMCAKARKVVDWKSALKESWLQNLKHNFDFISLKKLIWSYPTVQVNMARGRFENDFTKSKADSS